MIFFWMLYFLISIFITYLLVNLFENIFFKSLVLSISLAILTTIWFKIPGSDSIAPVISIFLLELTIIENNGILRILRPLGISFILIFIISLFFLRKRPKN